MYMCGGCIISLLLCCRSIVLRGLGGGNMHGGERAGRADTPKEFCLAGCLSHSHESSQPARPDLRGTQAFPPKPRLKLDVSRGHTSPCITSRGPHSHSSAAGPVTPRSLYHAFSHFSASVYSFCPDTSSGAILSSASCSVSAVPASSSQSFP